MMVMVKAFAYGSGSTEVANLLQFHRVDYLAVAYSDEGVALRENGIHLPIMVMNPDIHSFEKIFQYNLEPEIYNFKILKEYIEFCKQTPFFNQRNSYHIHLKIDTGMRRLGFDVSEIDALLDMLNYSLPWKVGVQSVFSHLAGADEQIHEEYSISQIDKFTQATQKLEEGLGYSFLKHILNSPGIVRFPEAHFDMVRLGIGLYGVETNQLQQGYLEHIGTLKTVISQIRYISKGETVGYSRKGIAEKDTKIAVIAIGYADGFSRKLSQGVGEVWVNDKKAKVIGNVCMDMTMIDITDIEAHEGDEVIIFSPDHSILDMAQKIGTIPYEILTSVSERVKRVFYVA
jgi:Alr-MurF fusion protein